MIRLRQVATHSPPTPTGTRLGGFMTRSRVPAVLLSLVALLGMITGVRAETIISKTDADHIFSLRRAGWEAYAARMTHPGGWKIRLSRHDTGTGVMAFDQVTGLGLSIQPLYGDETSPPDMLVVGSYYPAGSMPPFTPELKEQIERAAQTDLGPSYSVSAAFSKVASWDAIELTLTRTGVSPGRGRVR